MSAENIVYIGRKDTINYVVAIQTQVSNGQKNIFVKARGKAISKAVDVVEITKNKFLKDLKVKNIKIGSEQVMLKIEGKDDKPINVSTIEIEVEI